jgi:hypothetical protein
MTTTRSLAASLLFGGTLVLQGCFGSDSDSNPAAATDEPADQEEAINSVVFEEDADLADPDVMWFDVDDASPSEAAAAPIATHGWRRELLSLDKTIEITIENEQGEIPTADVTVTAEASGILHLWACGDSTQVEYLKDFENTGVRSLYFERVRDRGPRHRGWALMALSGVLIESPGTTRNINSVRIQAAGVDETVTGVEELIRREDVLRLPGGSEVTITVDTGDETDQVYLHLRHFRRRLALQSNGDGTFTGTYLTTERGGPRHFVVDVLSEGTLYDDEAPYDNLAWGYPYVIERDVDGDDVP